MAPSVLLIGAGGSFGPVAVAEFITQKASFGRIAILTSASRVIQFEKYKEHGIDIIVGIWTDPSVYRGFDFVISFAGNAILKDQSDMIDAAIEGTNGKVHFYPSEYGADLTLPNLTNVRYFRDKYATRRHAEAKGKDVPGFHYTYLLEGSFTDWAASEFFGVDQEKRTVKTYGRSDAIIQNTCIDDAAHWLVSSILLPLEDSSTPGRTIRVCGDTMTWKQVIDTLGEVQGVTYAHKYLDPSIAAKEEEKARLAGDVPSELGWSARPLAATGGALVGEPLDNEKFDFVPETVKQTFQRLFGKK